MWTTHEEQTIAFECAPATERPADEATGTCSHFVAKTPWLDAGETLKIAGKLDTATMRWQGFKPAKYAHHDDRQIASKR